MKQTIEELKAWANRLKLVTALGALFMSGALFSLTVCVWYYDRVISKIHGSYGGRIAAYNADIRRLQKEVDHERDVTRVQLGEQAADIDKLSGDVARLVSTLEETSRTAAQAASTARSAATTAQGAAANAAQSVIRRKEVEPAPRREPSRPKPRIEH